MGNSQTGCILDLETYQRLADAVDEITRASAEYEETLDGPAPWSEVESKAGDIYTWAKSVRDGWPFEDKSAVKSLASHAFYMKKYAGEENQKYAHTNLVSLKTDLKKVNEELNRAWKGLRKSHEAIKGDIALINDGPARGYLEEALRCLSSESYRASMVMSGCALELRIRTVYEQTKSSSSRGMDFARVIDTLEKDRTIPSGQSALVHLCRAFRNLTAHPTGFKCNEKEAVSLLQLIVEQLKKNPEAGDEGGKGESDSPQERAKELN